MWCYIEGSNHEAQQAKTKHYVVRTGRAICGTNKSRKKWGNDPKILKEYPKCVNCVTIIREEDAE